MARTVGYCAQQPWLVSGTLRDNILYGRPLDQGRWECLCVVESFRRHLVYSIRDFRYKIYQAASE
jgi:ABC-type multidrug transport system fused ATPase/permease subunit